MERARRRRDDVSRSAATACWAAFVNLKLAAQIPVKDKIVPSQRFSEHLHTVSKRVLARRQESVADMVKDQQEESPITGDCLGVVVVVRSRDFSVAASLARSQHSEVLSLIRETYLEPIENEVGFVLDPNAHRVRRRAVTGAHRLLRLYLTTQQQ
jgi:hypothetical protein